MVQLIDSDIRTREVLAWRGIHIFHGRTSSCSQKLRIFLNLKGIDWEGHELDLTQNETFSDWFLGINPRGLVPVLVWDGAVHIESNDILALLDAAFPEPRLIPPEQATEIADLLWQEDELHLDLRTLSFRFVMNRTSSNKSPQTLARYDDGTGTVQGAPDQLYRSHQIEFYERLASQGLPDATIRDSAAKFRTALDGLEQRLSAAPYYCGPALTVMDIAWFVYVSRLQLAGYPFARLHPRVQSWWEALTEDDRFSREVEPPPALRQRIADHQAALAASGATLAKVAGL